MTEPTPGPYAGDPPNHHEHRSRYEHRYHYEHRRAPLCSLDEGALAGLRHRTVIDARSGSEALALWQEEHAAAFEVPLHRHDCEEILTVIEGEIEARLQEEGGVRHAFPVGPGESFRIPPWTLHGFRVTGDRPVLLLALFASADPKIFKADGTESTPPWEGGEPDHLEDR